MPKPKSAHLFDHLVGGRQKRLRYGQAERLRGLEIDHQLIFEWFLHRQVCGLLALEKAIDIGRGPTKQVAGVRSVRNKAALNSVNGKSMDRGSRYRAISSIMRPRLAVV